MRLPDGSDPGSRCSGSNSVPSSSPCAASGRPAAPPAWGRRSVAIFGAGTAGLLFVQLARLAGFAKIIVSDLTESRLALAARFGATTTVRPRSVARRSGA